MATTALNTFQASLVKTGGAANLVFELVEKSADLLLRNVNQLDPLFDAFQVDKYTYLHAALLRAKYLSKCQFDRETLIAQTKLFFEQCDGEQAQKVSACVRIISQEFVDRLISWGVPLRGIHPVLVMIRKLQHAPHQLTALHADVCQLALASKCYRPVLTLLDEDILEVDKSYSVLDAKDYLLYFYYGGMIYAALKMWSRSLLFFELCLIVPKFSVSCIMIEALKKIILVSLIHFGKLKTSLDEITPQAMHMKPWKYYCQPYLQLAVAFAKDSPDAVNSVVESSRAQFVADHNYGLVKQVVKCHAKFRIRDLTKTFLTMSLSDVANRVKLSSAEEAERYLVEMIESEAIFARIDQRDGTVYFLDDPEQYNSLGTLQKLQKQMEECVALEKHLMQVSDKLVENPHYAEKMLELENVATANKPTVHY